MIFSPVLLKGVLPSELLAIVCPSMLKRRLISRQDVCTADTYLLQFCKRFEQLYSSDACTPNMHLHLHLKTCVHDLHTFWCYPFERYNGILSSMCTNRRCIEPQLMKKFCQTHQFSSLQDVNIPINDVFSRRRESNYNSVDDSGACTYGDINDRIILSEGKCSNTATVTF